VNLTEIEKAAREATPGKWHWEADAVKSDPIGRVRYQVTTLGKTITKVYYSSFEGGPTNAEWDARHIANCDPQTILKLVEIARAAKACERQLRSSALQPDSDEAVSLGLALKDVSP
jgi:hypothetical protein